MRVWHLKQAGCFALAGLTLFAAGCSSNAASSQPASSSPSQCLQGGSWTDANRNALNTIIGTYQGQGKAAVFDWDNTSQVRDVGNATYSQLDADGKFKAGAVPASFAPPFTAGGKKYSNQNLHTYQDGLAAATGSNPDTVDSDYPANQFAAGMFGALNMTVAQVMQATAAAYDDSSGAQDVGKSTLTNVGPASDQSPRPFLYPEMVDLYGCLISNGFNVHVASASAVWVVRWVVQNVLNPQLAAKFGPSVQLPPQNVMGIQYMLRDNVTGQLVNDSLLIRSDTPEGKAYASFDPKALARYTITSLQTQPPTDDVGKPANVIEWVSPDEPVLVGGDSQGDFENFGRAVNRLFIARLTEPSIEAAVVPVFQKNEPSTWIVQPTLFNENPGFVSSPQNLTSRLPMLPQSSIPDIAQSVNSLTQGGMLSGYTPPSG